MSSRRLFPTVMASGLAMSVLAATAALAGEGNAPIGGWRIEQGTAQPSYAVADATRTNLNVETVVLACEAGQDSRLLQLQLYMSDEGALQPTYRHDAGLKDDPRAVVVIDGHDFPVSLLFADDHVVLADAQDGPWPMLSTRLVEALQAGKTMTVKVDLLAEMAGAPAMDGETVVDLRAAGGRDAIVTMLDCAGTGGPSVAEASPRR
jgi:hypothetical protein